MLFIAVYSNIMAYGGGGECSYMAVVMNETTNSFEFHLGYFPVKLRIGIFDISEKGFKVCTLSVVHALVFDVLVFWHIHLHM